MLAMAEELGHDDMLAMAEGLGGHDSLFGDDDNSWALPILAAEENGGGGKMLVDIGNSDGGLKGKEVEVEAEVAPPPPAAMKGKKRRAEAAAGGGRDKRNAGNGGGEGDHEQHTWIERERRKKMRDMFTNLHSLIPHLPPRADKATIVDEAVQHIQKLEQTLESLEKQKAQMLKGKSSITTTCDIPSMVTQNKFPFQSREAFLAEQGSTSNAAVTLANPNRPPLFSGRPEFPAIFKTWTSPNVILNVYGKDAHINICCPKKPGMLTGICFVLEKYILEVVSAQVSSDRGRCMCMIHARANGPAVQFPGSLFLVEEIFKQAASEIMVWTQTQCV